MIGRLAIERGGRVETIDLDEYGAGAIADEAAGRANAWIKSLRHVDVAGRSLRDRFHYRGDSLWWFAELFLHKEGVVDAVWRTALTLDAVCEVEEPTRDRRRRRRTGAAPPAAAGRRPPGHRPAPRHRYRPPGGARTRRRHRREEPRADVGRRSPPGAAGATTRAGHRRHARLRAQRLLARCDRRGGLHRAGARCARRHARGADSAGRGRSAAQFPGAALVASADAGLAPAARRRRGDSGRGAHAGARPRPAHARSGGRATTSRTRCSAAPRCGRRARAGGYDVWDLIAPELQGIATLQFPWSARAMDEAGAAMELARPRLVLTYAEAGGWGRAIMLEARRRGIASRRHPARLHLSALAQLPARAGRDAAVRVDDPGSRLPAARPDGGLRSGCRAPSRGRRRVPAIGAGRHRQPGTRRARRSRPGHRPGRRARRPVPPSASRMAIGPRWSSRSGPSSGAGCRCWRRRSATGRVDWPPGANAAGGQAASGGNRRRLRRCGGSHLGRAPGPPTLDLPTLLAACDLVVTVNSTVAIDAMALGIPALSVGVPNNLTPFVVAGGIAGVCHPSELQPVLATAAVGRGGAGGTGREGPRVCRIRRGADRRRGRPPGGGRAGRAGRGRAQPGRRRSSRAGPSPL